MTDVSLHRRQVLRGIGAGSALVGVALATPAAAEKVCGAFDGYGLQQCEAGISREVASATAAAVGSQHLNQWCWAACIEMVFRFHGFHVPQERIVEETWGGIVNMPAWPEQILGNLNRPWRDDGGRPFEVESDAYTANEFTAAQDLAENKPLIIGTMGHAMVLTSILYRRDAQGNGEVTGAVVRDPWPGVGRRQLTGMEWHGRAFLARIRVYPA
ncbi:MAG: papain-like cysteine protease family protein [Alphaproteobacteria bacterium]